MSSDMDTVAAAAVIIGTLMPIIVAFAQQPRYSARTRAIIAAVACLIAGAVNAYAQGQLTTEAVLVSVAAVLTASTATYQGFWRHVGIAAVERATSPGQQREEDTPPH